MQNAHAYLRLQRVPIVGGALLLLTADAIGAAILAPWWLALSFVLLGLALAYLNRRHMVVYVKIAQSLHSFRSGQLVVSEARLREALPYAERLPADDPLRGTVYHHLAEVSRLLGDYTDAEAFGVKALEVAERAYGDSHPRTIDAVLGLAQSYLDIARYPQAKRLLDRATIALNAAGESLAPLHAHCLAELGRWWSEQEFFAEAEASYRQAAELYQASGDARLVLSVRLSHAIVLARLGKLSEAEEIIQTALQAESGREESMTLAMCLDQLALVRLLQAQPAEAEQLQRRALALTEKFVGPNTPALSPGLALLGGILKVQGKWPEADQCYRNALRLREEYSAPEHPALAELLEDYAELLEHMGRSEEAQFHLHRAHQIRDFQAAARNV